MDQSEGIYTEWYMVFTSSALDHWLINRLDPYFQHCYAVKESPGGQFWIIIDSRNAYTEVRMESKLDYPHIRVLCPDCTILPVRAKINPKQNRHTFCVINCVEICKSLLGIRSFWTWTPKDLYRYLEQNHVISP